VLGGGACCHRHEGAHRLNSSVRPKATFLPVTNDQCSHWLELAGMASFFTQKSHAAIFFADKGIIIRFLRYPSDIFDSHYPLQSR
jgi:hypothetical protein